MDVQSLKDSFKQSLQKAQDEQQRGTGFFGFRECKDVSDKGNLIRIVRPLYFPAGQIEPWLSLKKWNVPFPGAKYGKDCYAPKFFGLADPIDETKNSLDAAGDPDGDNLKFRSENIMFILDRESERETEKGIQVCKFPDMLKLELLDFLADDDNPLPFDLSETGCDVYVRKTGTGLQTRYRVKKGPVGMVPDAERFIAEANKTRITNFVPLDTYETLVGVLNGEYDKDEARAARKERDKTAGKIVDLFFFGKPLEGEEEDPNEKGPAPTPAATPGPQNEQAPTPQPESQITPTYSPGTKSHSEMDVAKTYIGKAITVTVEGVETPGKVVYVDSGAKGAVLVVQDSRGELFGVYFAEGAKWKLQEAPTEKPKYTLAGGSVADAIGPGAAASLPDDEVVAAKEDPEPAVAINENGDEVLSEDKKEQFKSKLKSFSA